MVLGDSVSGDREEPVNVIVPSPKRIMEATVNIRSCSLVARGNSLEDGLFACSML